jgi:hypothetical protein
MVILSLAVPTSSNFGLLVAMPRNRLRLQHFDSGRSYVLSPVLKILTKHNPGIVFPI